MSRPGPERARGEDRRAGVGSHPGRDAGVAEQEVEETFVDVVDEGRRRLSRPWAPLLATGAVGGIDVGLRNRIISWRIEWDPVDGHEQGFRSSPQFGEFFSAVRPFFAEIEELKHYQVRPMNAANRVLRLGQAPAVPHATRPDRSVGRADTHRVTTVTVSVPS